jgi:hypothetical protein
MGGLDARHMIYDNRSENFAEVLITIFILFLLLS